MPTPSFTDIIKAYLEAQFGGDVPPIPGITIDSELSDTSENPVQNKVINAALQSKGTYSKPSGGIPASDLASGVIPVVPQMATQTDMSDWTTGKTVDAAVLKADLSFASQELEGLVIAVDVLQTAVSQKANSADIPTKTSDLTNDSGFQTASQVQAAIAPLQTKAITDTGGYYSTDTVDGALQEIGAELAGVNTLLGSGVIT